MTKLEIWLHEHGLSAEEVAKEGNVSPIMMMKYVTGETVPIPREMTRITQACRRMLKEEVSSRELFDLPPVDTNF